MTNTLQALKEKLIPEPKNRQSEDLSSLDADSFSRFLDRQVPASANPLASSGHHRAESRRVVEFRDTLRSHPDRGSGFYEFSRTKNWRPSLVESGRHAGRSKVKLTGLGSGILGYHRWKRDFFHSCINLSLPVAVAFMAAAYILSFLVWGIAWFILYKVDHHCLIGFKKVQKHAFVSSFLFATETQQTIGYGLRAPNDCWISAWMVIAQTIWGQLLDATVMGVIFARISYPKQRARTIFISDCAVVARRDGLLKFMVRLGDIRRTSVVAPTISATMYLWGQGHTTAEGENIPVRMEAIEFNYPQRVEMLLPIVVEHLIDERSPLFSHTHDSLTSLSAEIVVTFEGTSEGGDQFMARQSYLPNEIHWGFVFAPIIMRAGLQATHHTIDISRFHDIVPQENLTIGPPGRLSSKVVAPVKGSVPWPNLTDNTLVLSDSIVLAPIDGKLQLQFRVGDTYPHNMLEVHARAYIYRWRPRKTVEGEILPYDVKELDLGYITGHDRLLLRLPVVVRHVVNADSPVSRWQKGPTAIAEDADSEIVVVVEGVQYTSSKNMMRQKVYSVLNDVKWGHRFAPCVTRPKQSADKRPLVAWSAFHKIVPSGSDHEEDDPALEKGKLSARSSAQGTMSGTISPHSPRGSVSGYLPSRLGPQQVLDTLTYRSGQDSGTSGSSSPRAQTHSRQPSNSALPFGSMLRVGSDLGMADDSAASLYVPAYGAKGKPASPYQDKDEDSSSTLTGSYTQDWKKTRSLYNVSFDPDETEAEQGKR